MQQMSGIVPHTVTPSSVPTTGPGTEATTAPMKTRETPPQAVVSLIVSHNQVTMVAELAMGRGWVVLRRWERRASVRIGWVQVEGPTDVQACACAVGHELAALVFGLPFPYALANMLPRASTVAARDAIAQAQREVDRA